MRKYIFRNESGYLDGKVYPSIFSKIVEMHVGFAVLILITYTTKINWTSTDIQGIFPKGSAYQQIDRVLIRFNKKWYEFCPLGKISNILISNSYQFIWK